jgi:hypothetical protein
MLRLLVALAIGLCATLPAAASDPFERGAVQIGLFAGSGRAFGEDYLVLGGGVGYYLVDGLALGLDFEAWSGADPRIYKATPQLRWVLPLRSAVRPYVGGFYRWTDIDGLESLDSAGARAGLYVGGGGNAFVGIGVAHERYVDCDEAIYTRCSDTYPELSVNFRL